MGCIGHRASAIALGVTLVAHSAQAGGDDVAVQFGLIQPLFLHGGNVELDYRTQRLSFDISHGFWLDMGSATAVGQQRAQHLVYHLPYSTGFGIGYRLTRALDLRVEPKLHEWNVFYDGDPQDGNHQLVSYKTFTLGLGAYYRWCPFATRSDWVAGATITGSIRFWPTVLSTLPGGAFHYSNRFTGEMETLEPASIGIADTPLILNISIGYTFGI
jgi:hypothetical protein